jgi:hypothetical protein
MERLEEVLTEAMPSTPTPFDIFCRKKLNEFRDCVTMQLSRTGPLKAKLQKLVDMIIYLHAPGCRGNIAFYECLSRRMVKLVFCRSGIGTYEISYSRIGRISE